MKLLTSRRPQRYVHLAVFLVAAVVAVPATTGRDECFDCGVYRETSSWAGLEFPGEAQETSCARWVREHRIPDHETHRWVGRLSDGRWPHLWLEERSPPLALNFAWASMLTDVWGGRTFEQWFDRRRAATAGVPDDESALLTAEDAFRRQWYEDLAELRESARFCFREGTVFEDGVYGPAVPDVD